ncbi:hypothetical protein QJS77_08380, partial [Enterococcus faecium]
VNFILQKGLPFLYGFFHLHKIFYTLQSAWKVFFDFLRNILCCVLLLGFVLLIFLFPPFIFIFAGGVWKLVSIILTIGNER